MSKERKQSTEAAVREIRRRTRRPRVLVYASERNCVRLNRIQTRTPKDYDTSNAINTSLRNIC
jgi:hypothetical protein